MADTSSGARSVVVFGGTGALGSAVVARLSSEGASVVAVDATRSADGVGGPSTHVALDVLDEAAVAAFFAGLDVVPWAVVNVIGGYTPPQRMAELDLSVLRGQLELNLVSAATITKHALIAMTAGGQGGRIVHTASRVAFEHGLGGFAYSVSKLGVVRLVESAAAEVVGEGITVNCIVPSIIDSAANRAAMPDADHGRWPKPEQLASVVSLLLSDAAAVVSGAAVPVYGRA